MGMAFRRIRYKGFLSRYLLDVRHPECDEISNLGDKNCDDSLNDRVYRNILMVQLPLTFLQISWTGKKLSFLKI
jgi:hypothetical protein